MRPRLRFRRRPAIRYVIPSYTTPSWGIGMLLTHVDLLRRHGFEAEALCEGEVGATAWLELEVPSRPLLEGGARARASDVVVVPEVMAGDERCLALPGRKVLFAQNPFSIFSGLQGRAGFAELGYLERAMAVLPSVGDVLRTFFGLDAVVVPPCIAPYFFLDPDLSAAPEREARVLLVPQKSPSPDRAFLEATLQRWLAGREGASAPGGPWQLVVLQGLPHREVARLMQRSLLLVNTNLGEAFNTTVPEAMAAGCVPLCYEAYGGRDFLRDGENALVFPNHYVFPLLERLHDLLERPDERAPLLERLRSNGLATSLEFTARRTEEALLGFVRELL